MWTAALFAMVFALVPFPAHSVTERRIALVIGNDDYEHLDTLNNAVLDAEAVATKLTRLGFDTQLLRNATEEDLFRAMQTLERRLDRDAVGLVYYAGHGVEVNGLNYLIPVDAELTSEIDLEYRALPKSRILQAMEKGGSRLNIIILDACRDNPLPKQVRSASSSRGLQFERPPANEQDWAILFSAAPGEVAEDGDPGTHGVFTEQLLAALDQPGLTLSRVFQEVNRRVKDKTFGRQNPWNHTAMTRPFLFLRNATEPQALPSFSDDVLLISAHEGSIAQDDDTDVYRIDVSADAPIIAIYSRGAIDVNGSLSKASANGERLHVAQNDDSGSDLNFRLARVLKPGTYYLSVTTSRAGSVGSYTVHVDRYRASGLENSISSAFEKPNDAHYYVTTISASSSVELQFNGRDHADLSLLRVAASGAYEPMVADRDSDLYEDLKSGEYYLRVTSANTGPYEIQFREYLNLTTSVARSTAGRYGTDYYQIKIGALAPYVSIFTTGNLDTDFTLKPRNADEYYRSRGNDAGPLANFHMRTKLEPGMYDLQVDWRGKTDVGDYVIHLSADESPGDTHGNTLADATALSAVGRSSINGWINSDDVDVFTVDVDYPVLVLIQNMADTTARLRWSSGGVMTAPLVIGHDELSRFLYPGTHGLLLTGSDGETGEWYDFDVTVIRVDALTTSADGELLHSDDVDLYVFSGSESAEFVTVYVTGEDRPRIDISHLGDERSLDDVHDGSSAAMWTDRLQPGNYIAAVDSAIGPYTIHLLYQHDSDSRNGYLDSGADFSSANGLQNRVRRHLDEPNEAHYFRFEVSEATPWISVKVDTIGAFGLPIAELMASAADGPGDVIASWNPWERFWIKLAPGPYILRVTSESGGSYILGHDSARNVPLGSDTQAILQPGSVDAYRFDVSERERLTTLSGAIEAGRVELWRETDEGRYESVFWGHNTDDGGEHFRISKVLDVGAYVVTVTGDRFGRYRLALNMADVPQDEHSDEPALAELVYGTQLGTLVPGDIDFFRIDITEMEPWIRVDYTSDGPIRIALMVEGTDTPEWKAVGDLEIVAMGGSFFPYEFKTLSRVLDAGTYFVGISPEAGFTRYAVDISSDKAPGDRHGDMPTSATLLTSSESGWVAGDDVDYFRFTVADELSWVIIRVIDDLRDAPDSWSRLTVGQLIRQDEGQEPEFLAEDLKFNEKSWGQGSEHIVTQLLPPGTYYFRVQSLGRAQRLGTLREFNRPFFETIFSDVTSYTAELTVSALPADQHSDDPSDATLLISTATGWIGGEDVDYFRIVVSENEPSVFVYSTGGIPMVGTLLAVTESGSLSELDRAERTDGTMEFGIGMELAAGTYYLRVETFEREAGPYKIHLETAR